MRRFQRTRRPKSSEQVHIAMGAESRRSEFPQPHAKGVPERLWGTPRV